MGDLDRRRLGLALRERRRRAGLTLAQLGERTGLTGSRLAHIEAGRDEAVPEVLERLARALGATVNELRVSGT